MGMPVGDLDFGLPGGSVNVDGLNGNDNNHQNFSYDDDSASITTTQINALAERNKERVARLQKWKEETAASHDPRINQSNAREDPDEVLDAFKERVANEEMQRSEPRNENGNGNRNGNRNGSRNEHRNENRNEYRNEHRNEHKNDNRKENPEPVRSGSPNEADHQTRRPSARKSRGENRESRASSRSKSASRRSRPTTSASRKADEV